MADPLSATRSIAIVSLSFLMLVQCLCLVPVVDPIGNASATGSRIIVVSNQTSIPLAMGTPSTGLAPFTGVLANLMGVHITGQVVDGNYTPLWQAGSALNHGIANAQVHWSFGTEPDRAHAITADEHGMFSFFITPNVQAPLTTHLRFWFDGKSDTVYGIPIYPPAKIIYDVVVPDATKLTVVPTQARAMAGDTILVQGSLKGSSGNPAADEGLIASIDGAPAKANAHSGWFVDNVVLGPLAVSFDSGLDGFTPGGKGTWATGTPSAGPMSGFSSFGCAGAALGGNYAYDTDGWLQSPTVDLSSTDQATLMFASWSDIAKADELVVELSNDNGLTWPARVSVTSGATWTPVSIPVSTFSGTAYGTVQFTHKPDVKFRFRLIGHTMPLTTGTDGTYEFSYSIPKDKAAGAAVIRVEHPSSSSYEAVTSTGTFDVARNTMIDTVAPDVAYRGIPAEAKAVLLDVDGSPLKVTFPNQQVPKPTVLFWLRQGGNEQFLGERPLGPDGSSAIGLEVSRSDALGPAQVRYYFRGNEFYAPAEAVRDIVIKAHTELDIQSPRTASQLAQNNLVVTGQVRVVGLESSSDNSPDPIAKKDLQVFLDGKMVGTATTDVNGLFTFVMDAKGIDLGTSVIRVAFQGDIVYEPSEATVDFSLLSNTTIQAQPKDIIKGDTAVIDGTLSWAQGGVQGIIEVSVNGSLYRKVVTGPDGSFAVDYKPLTEEPGPLSVTLTYRGSKVYRSTSITLSYIVRSGTMLLVPKEPVVGHRGEVVTLKGTLVDAWGEEQGTPVAGAQVELVSPTGAKDTVTTNTNGNFTYLYIIPSTVAVGDSEVLASFSGPYRGSSTVAIPINVTSATSLVFSGIGNGAIDEGAQFPVNVVLKDDNGMPIVGRTVTVYDWRRTGTDNLQVMRVLFKGPTDSTGSLSFRSSMSGNDTHTITASFDGDSHYEASEASAYLNIRPAPVVSTPVQQRPTVVLGGGLSLILILTLVLTESGKYFLFKLVLVPMYTKLKKEDVLDHFVRGQIYGLIRLQPGAHYNFIKQKLDLKNGVLSYHLATLEREGYVLSEMDGIYRRFYPNHVKFEVDYPIFLSKLQERIVDLIKKMPGVTQKEVAKELQLSTSTINDNIQVLKQANIIDLRRDGKRTRCFMVET